MLILPKQDLSKMKQTLLCLKNNKPNSEIQNNLQLIYIPTVQRTELKLLLLLYLFNDDIFSVRLPDDATIFTAEAKAIDLAFECM